MHEEDFWSCWLREDERGKQERKAKTERKEEERVKRGKKKQNEENETVTVKRMKEDVGSFCVEAFSVKGEMWRIVVIFLGIPFG